MAVGVMRDLGDDTLWEDVARPHRTDAAVRKRSRAEQAALPTVGALALEDFFGHMPTAKFIHIASGSLWPAKSVNARVPPVMIAIDDSGEPVMVPASNYIIEKRPVDQMIWQPGEPQLIVGKSLLDGGWVKDDRAHGFNLYRPPELLVGSPEEAWPWVEHVREIYPAEAEHIFDWVAHRVQQPGTKCNHALVLGGDPGIGKDALLQPVVPAIGQWNFQEVSPQQLLGRFNGFLKSVILRISEARDMGEFNRYQFYEHTKTVIASPPDVLRCDTKNVPEFPVANVCGVVFTSNNLATGLFLPPDDRRHFVAWSEVKPEDIPPGKFDRLFSWYERGGIGHVAAFLRRRDLSHFDPKAPPPKTEWFWQIVSANQIPEHGQLADLLEKWFPQLPHALTIEMLVTRCDENQNYDLKEWLRDKKNRRAAIPEALRSAGYIKVINEDAPSDGHWKTKAGRRAIYALERLSKHERITAARRL